MNNTFPYFYTVDFYFILLRFLGFLHNYYIQFYCYYFIYVYNNDLCILNYYVDVLLLLLFCINLFVLKFTVLNYYASCLGRTNVRIGRAVVIIIIIIVSLSSYAVGDCRYRDDNAIFGIMCHFNFKIKYRKQERNTACLVFTVLSIGCIIERAALV